MNNEKDSVSGFFYEYGEIKKPTYKEQAYQLIKDAILYQKFKPDVIYSQDALCQELGVSRTPVREALLELQKEGYILFCRGKGIRIVALDDKSIRDILEMRINLEGISAALAAERATDEEMEYIGACLRESHDNLSADPAEREASQCYRLDHQFHRAVALATHNDLLCRTLDDVLNLYLRFEVMTVYNNKISANEIIEEHSRLYQALLQGDPTAAGEAAKNHLNEAFRRTLPKYWQ